MTDEPTLGEVMRQVRSLVDQVRDLVQELRSDYVRKDLYDARHHALTRRVDDLEREADDREKARVAFQRQIAAGIIIQIVVLILGALFVVGGLR